MDILTKTQEEVLHNITVDFLTVKQIAKHRGVTIYSIYKILKKLRKKGYLKSGYLGGYKKTRVLTPQFCTPPTFPVEKIRLHGQQFLIKIISKSPLYDKVKSSKNILIFDRNTVQLFKDSLMVSANEFLYFYGSTAAEAQNKSLKYWLSYWHSLEERLNISLICPNKAHIKQVKQHFSVYDKKLGKYIEDNDYKMKIRATDDGKVWFLMDKSMGDHEREAVHPETAQEDTDNILEPFFNDLRDNKPPRLTDIMKLIKEITETNKETAAGLNAIANYLKSAIPEEKPQDRKLPDYFG